MEDLEEYSPKAKYALVLLDNPIVDRMRVYGNIQKMSEIDILYMTVAALDIDNKKLLKMLDDIVTRKPPNWIIPAHATVHYPEKHSDEPTKMD